MLWRCLRCAVLAGLLAVAVGDAASAHAFLDHAQPPVGGTLAVPPTEVRIWFTEALEPAFSTITVTDAQGQSVARGRASVDGKDPSLLEIALPPLSAGTYRVQWRVISVDTHPTEGEFTFTVKP